MVVLRRQTEDSEASTVVDGCLVLEAFAEELREREVTPFDPDLGCVVDRWEEHRAALRREVRNQLAKVSGWDRTGTHVGGRDDDVRVLVNVPRSGLELAVEELVEGLE